MHQPGASPAGGQGGNAPWISFLTPQFFFLSPHGIFLGGRSWCFLAEKTLKLAISARQSLRISAKTFFFWDLLLLGGKLVISPRKSHRISAKTFAPPWFKFCPPPPDLAKLAMPLASTDLGGCISNVQHLSPRSSCCGTIISQRCCYSYSKMSWLKVKKFPTACFCEGKLKLFWSGKGLHKTTLMTCPAHLVDK